jgi:hypothetical protein
MLRRKLLKTSTTEFKKVSFSTNGNGGSGNGHDNGQRSYHYHPRFRGGARLAALRAFSGAEKVLEEGMSPVMAADWVGSNANYIAAMITIIESNDEDLLDRVLTGRVGVLAAAAQVEGFIKLLAAFKAATTENKAAFRKTIGDNTLFDELFGDPPASAANPVEIGAMSITIEPLGPAE